MRSIALILGLSFLATFAGCDQNKDRKQVTVDAPGVKVDADQNRDRPQTIVEAPGVKVDAGADGTHVRAPGADVDVNKK
jgi:hypothetical protein